MQYLCWGFGCLIILFPFFFSLNLPSFINYNLELFLCLIVRPHLKLARMQSSFISRCYWSKLPPFWNDMVKPSIKLIKSILHRRTQKSLIPFMSKWDRKLGVRYKRSIGVLVSVKFSKRVSRTKYYEMLNPTVIVRSLGSSRASNILSVSLSCVISVVQSK